MPLRHRILFGLHFEVMLLQPDRSVFFLNSITAVAAGKGLETFFYIDI